MKKIFYASLLFAGMTMTGCGSNQPQTRDNESATAPKNEVTDKQGAENIATIQGTYQGTWPAADGPGINMLLTINNDSTYTLEYDYIDRDGKFKDEGICIIEDDLVTLKEKKGENSYFKVEEGQLRRLDNDKQAITGELKDMYVLKKQ